MLDAQARYVACNQQHLNYLGLSSAQVLAHLETKEAHRLSQQAIEQQQTLQTAEQDQLQRQFISLRLPVLQNNEQVSCLVCLRYSAEQAAQLNLVTL